MPSPVIVPTYFQEDGGKKTGVRFQVQLSRGKAVVSILESPDEVDFQQFSTVLEILGELGKTLTEAAQQPELIQWHLPGDQ